MEPEGNLLPNIMTVLISLMAQAFFAASEVAIIAVNDGKIRTMSRDGDKRAKMISRLTEKPSRFLSAMRAGVTLSALSAAFAAAVPSAGYIARAMDGLPFPQDFLRGASTALAIIALSYISLTFGGVVPKRIAAQNYEGIAFAVVPAVVLCEKALRPLTLLISATSGLALRLMGIDPEREPEEVTEEEIRMMVDVGGERGSIEESEKEMINNIFEFDDRTVDGMMTHRTEIVSISLDTPLDEIIKTALESGCSRIPVCEDGLDEIAGILYVKDLLALVTRGENDADFKLSDYMREPLYVIESNTCMDVLSEFKAKKIQIAIVVDEYGGTAGLVTMEDLIEAIVGNIQDEYDDEEEDEEIFSLGENRYLVDGLTSLEDIDKFFGLTLSEDEDFDTVGGFVVDRLGRIPSDGEHPSVDEGGYRFIVSEIDERRVSRIEVERLDLDKAASSKQ